MIINKRGEVDSFLTLFVSTILIVVIILVFSIFSGIFIRFSTIDSEFFSFSPIESDVVRYIEGYSVGPFNILKDDLCEIGEAVAIKGPYKGKCMCDSSAGGGYYFSTTNKPFVWFFPPCVKSPYSGNSARPIDLSIELGDENRHDEGICVYYISNRYYNELSIGKEVPFQTIDGTIFEDIFNYEMKIEGHIGKVYMIPEEDENFIFTRETCAGMSRQKRLIEPVILTFRTYPIFYNYMNAPNNVLDGYEYDLGYCFLFSIDGRIDNVAGTGETTRDNCYKRYTRESQKDSELKVGFFVKEKSGGEKINVVEVRRKGEIRIFYSFDYHAKVRGEDLGEQKIKESCKRFNNYDLTFITGTLEYRDGEVHVREDGKVHDYGQRDSHAMNACKLESESFLDEGSSFFEKYNRIGEDDFERLGEGDICCYLNEVSMI